MGSRVVSKSMDKDIFGHKFKNYGSHHENYENLPYFTIAIAIGIVDKELN